MVDDQVLLPGTIGLTQISGEVGKLIRIGQWLNGNGYANYQHAFVYLGNGELIEAEPGGARIRPVTEYADVYWCTNIAKQFHAGNLQHAADIARGFEGIGYSFIDYFALALHRFHVPIPLLRKYIESTKHQICSQLCDNAYEEAGLKLFHDKRWAGDVTPLGIYDLDQSLIVKSLRSPPPG
jgi:hypothetical protein